MGVKIANSLRPITYNQDGIVITGFMSSEMLSGSDHLTQVIKKEMCYCYVNKRFIRTPKFISTSLKCYKDHNKATKYLAVYYMDLSQKEIDFNVATDKQEVIFGALEAQLRTIFAELISQFLEDLKSDQKIVVSQTGAGVGAGREGPGFTQTKFKVQVAEQVAEQAVGGEYKPRSSFGNFIVDYKNAGRGERFTYDSESGWSSQKKYGGSQEDPDDGDAGNAGKGQVKIWTKHVPRTGNGTIEEDVGNEDAESSYENSNKFPSTNLAAQGSQPQFTVLKRPHPDQSPSQLEHNQNRIIEEDAEYQHDCGSSSKHKPESKRIRTNSKSPAKDSAESQDELRKFHAQETPEPNLPGLGKIALKNSLNEYKGEMRTFQENMVKKLHTWELNHKSAKFVKDNFQDLSILGQFNTGFIVTFFEMGQNYYIIDQHASDEKFKYEGFIFSEHVNNPRQQELVNLVK